MVPVISLHLYTKWSKIVKTGGKLESQGFSFFTVVKISTTNSGIIDKIQRFVAELSGVEITDHRILENMGVGSRKN